MENFKSLLKKSIKIWLEEDIGDGDHTTLATIPTEATGKVKLLSKDNGIIAGIGIVKELLTEFDAGLVTDVFIHDGENIREGDIIMEIRGSVRSLLQIERLMLNLLQRLSGIATRTRYFADLIHEYHARILDTRKTTPGLRLFEKEAVRLGGGMNHRAGLYDMILIKDNHIDFAGGIEKAILQARSYLKDNNLSLKIEVEARNIQDVGIILETGGVDRILLDNFTPELTRSAVKMIDRTVETESSGGISELNIREYAACGVDFISVGALTHQIKSLDLSLKAAFR